MFCFFCALDFHSFAAFNSFASCLNCFGIFSPASMDFLYYLFHGFFEPACCLIVLYEFLIFNKVLCVVLRDLKSTYRIIFIERKQTSDARHKWNPCTWTCTWAVMHSRGLMHAYKLNGIRWKDRCSTNHEYWAAFFSNCTNNNKPHTPTNVIIFFALKCTLIVGCTCCVHVSHNFHFSLLMFLNCILHRLIMAWMSDGLLLNVCLLFSIP